MPRVANSGGFRGDCLLAKLADRRSDIRREKELEEADARAKARRPDWVDKRHNCCEVKGQASRGTGLLRQAGGRRLCVVLAEVFSREGRPENVRDTA